MNLQMKNPKKTQFYERFREALEESGLTIGELSSETGVSQSAFSRYSTGTVPFRRTVETIARCLKVNPDWLLNGRGEKRSRDQFYENQLDRLINSADPRKLADLTKTLDDLELREYILSRLQENIDRKLELLGSGAK